MIVFAAFPCQDGLRYLFGGMSMNWRSIYFLLAFLIVQNTAIADPGALDSWSPDLLAERQSTDQPTQQRPFADVSARARRKSISGTATVSGALTDATTLSGIEFGQVYLRDEPGTIFLSTQADSSGSFSFTGLAAGTYFVYSATRSSFAYVDELYTPAGDYPCAHCPLVPEAQIVVADGAIVTGIDMALEVGATISGTVTDSVGVPIQDWTAVAYNAQYFWDGGRTDAAGAYSIGNLPNLEFRVYLRQYSASPNQTPNLRTEIYPNVACNPFDCASLAAEGMGSALTIVGGSGITAVDFALEPGAVISGTIYDAVSMLPISETQGSLLLVDATGRNQGFLTYYGTSGPAPINDATYSIGGLLPGDYFLEASENTNHVREIHPDVHCPWSGCQRVLIGTPISLGANTVASGTDFYLDQGGHITVTVRDSSTMLPIDSLFSYFQVIDSAGKVAGGGFSPAQNGQMATARAVPAGTYTVRTGNDFGGTFTYPYIDQLFASPATTCVGYDCDYLSGTPVSVTIGTNNDIGNIDLDMGATISGTVTELGSSTPIPDVFVLIYNDDVPPVFSAMTTTLSDGSFSITGLLPGDYFVLTNNGSNLPVPGFYPKPVGTWVDILYNGQPCPGGSCDFHAIGDVVTVSSTRGASLVIEQSPGAQISGRLTSLAQGLPIANGQVDVFNDQGARVASFFSDDDGYYLTTGLLDGTYYLLSNVDGALIDTAYGGVLCSTGCDWTDATPVMVTEAQPATDIDLVLRANYIFGNGLE